MDLKVSIHALTRRATVEIITFIFVYVVSIHALTRRATKGDDLVGHEECFNPRPHAEGDRGKIDRFLDMLVSIHALTRRATLYLR